MGKFLTEFKEFALKGNVVDMAVGVIIGGAFGKIVSSLVDDVIMPLFAALGSAGDFTSLKWVLKEGVEATDTQAAVTEVAINYGMFIQNIVDFLIIAFSIFMILKVMMKFKKQKEEAPAPAPEPSNEEKLLTEIRDLLKNK
jgi:large conductance mechanosensitive channel